MKNQARISARAKINLFLGVTGRREDGFHDLISLVVPITLADELELALCPEHTDCLIRCDDDTIPVDERNLCHKAWAAFNAASGLQMGLDIGLSKRIPYGAGLGGGSSDAAAVLRYLNEAHGRPLSVASLSGVAASVGADCPLFLVDGPSIIRGKGERVEPLDAALVDPFSAQSLLLIQPEFSVDTVWAYRQMAAQPEVYLSAEEVEARWLQWQRGDLAWEDLLFNNFEAVAFDKFLAYEAFDAALRSQGLPGIHLTGSGSAFFLSCKDDEVRRAALALAESALGSDCFMAEVKVTKSYFDLITTDP